MLIKYALKCGHGARMRPCYDSLTALSLIKRALQHLVRHGIGEEHQEIRAAYLIAQTAVHLGIYLSLAAVRLTEHRR